MNTAFTELNDEQLAYKAGASAFIPKPVNRKHIEKILANIK